MPRCLHAVHRWGPRIALLTALVALVHLPGLVEVSADAECPCALQPLSGPVCVTWEGLAAGTLYAVGDSLVVDGAVATVEPLISSAGSPVNGLARVGDRGYAGGSGLDMEIDCAVLRLDFGGELTALGLRFGSYGHNVNVSINGDLRNVANMAVLDGETIGGVSVSVTNGFGSDAGTMRLTGAIHELLVGGQEFALDDLCPEAGCVDMEDLVPGTRYYVGDTFQDSGVTMRGAPFTWMTGEIYSGGHAEVTDNQWSGAWGHDLAMNNILVAFEFSEDIRGLSFAYGEYGGSLNLNVNSQVRRFLDWPDLDGQIVGGVGVNVTTLGANTGLVRLVGEIRHLAIGGQELWIDNLCPAACCAAFEALPLAARYEPGDTLWQRTGWSCDGVLTLSAFTWSDGTVTTEGYASIVDAAPSGGTGQALWLNNSTLDVDWTGPASQARILFGEYGGNVNLRINGVMHNVQNLSTLDGAVIGGVEVQVVNGMGNDRGRLLLVGPISSLGIGGQELYVDDICIETLARTFLPLVRS